MIQTRPKHSSYIVLISHICVSNGAPARQVLALLPRFLPVFVLLLTLLVIGYSVAVVVVDTVGRGLLGYGAAVGPFVVISAAIMTIPLMITTVLVAGRVLGGHD